jgi:hypothetical protein
MFSQHRAYVAKKPRKTRALLPRITVSPARIVGSRPFAAILTQRTRDGARLTELLRRLILAFPYAIPNAY